MATKLGEMALVVGVGDGTNIIIMCLPYGSGELLIMFLRERRGGDVATKAGGLVFLPHESGEWRTETWQPHWESCWESYVWCWC